MSRDGWLDGWRVSDGGHGTIGESCLYFAAWENLKVRYSSIASRISYAVTWWRCPERRSVYCRFLSWTFWRRIPCVHLFFLEFTPRLEPYRMRYSTVQVHQCVPVPSLYLSRFETVPIAFWNFDSLSSRAERSVELEHLRDLINTEVKNIQQRKQFGKLSIGARRPAWEDMSWTLFDWTMLCRWSRSFFCSIPLRYSPCSAHIIHDDCDGNPFVYLLSPIRPTSAIHSIGCSYHPLPVFNCRFGRAGRTAISDIYIARGLCCVCPHPFKNLNHTSECLDLLVVRQWMCLPVL